MKAVVQPIFISPDFRIFDFTCREEPDSKSRPESAGHHEITFTRTGDFEIQHGRQSQVIHNQVLLLTNPGSELVFSHRSKVRDTCTTFRVSSTLLSDISDGRPDFSAVTLFSTPALDYVHSQLYRIIVQPYLSGNRLKIDELLLRLLHHVYSVLRGPQPPLASRTSRIDQHLETVERAKDYMLANFHWELSLWDISRAAYVSQYHFSRIFCAFTRRSPYSYLMQVRLNHASRLLKDTSQSVTEVCYDSGFNNFPHFISTFTRHFGLSPSRFRKRKP